jgi:hypothetical protein
MTAPGEAPCADQRRHPPQRGLFGGALAPRATRFAIAVATSSVNFSSR